jgi:hypothetical protein
METFWLNLPSASDRRASEAIQEVYQHAIQEKRHSGASSFLSGVLGHVIGTSKRSNRPSGVSVSTSGGDAAGEMKSAKASWAPTMVRPSYHLATGDWHGLSTLSVLAEPAEAEEAATGLVHILTDDTTTQISVV